MKQIETSEAAAPPPAKVSLSPGESMMLGALDAQRRLQLLRILVPGLTILVLLNLAFSIFEISFPTVIQIGAGLLTLGLAFFGTFTNRAALASLSLLIGMTLSIMLVILFNTSWNSDHALDVRAMPQFFLLLVPILLAGLTAGPRTVVATTLSCFIFTVLVFRLTPAAPLLILTFHERGGSTLIVAPLLLQLGVGFLVLLGIQSFQRTQSELADLHVAYAREKDLEILKDQFIANVNHELRTPIMALQGYIELAQELGDRGDMRRQRQMLSQGKQAAEDLAAMVRSVLNIRPVEADPLALHPRRLALASVISGAISMLDPRELQKQQRQIHVTVAPELEVFADEERLRQVLMNLLTNALKYSDQGAPIDISARPIATTRLRSDRNGMTRSRPIRTPPLVKITVRDYGHGIPAEQAAIIFERFARLDRDIASQTPGTGLGLAICRSYVEAMGGHIWVESSGVRGQGSTFHFTLPAEPGEIRIAD